ncbi:hypothetical protein KAI36_02649 [Paenibacillus sp. S02]|nr:hypothetical protein KAI36_02649 [Paenibacillus sp. S02]
MVFTQNDLKTLPPAFSMPNAYLAYITRLRNVFLDQGDAYTGDADVAITAGFVNNGDLSQAKRAVYYAWSPSYFSGDPSDGITLTKDISLSLINHRISAALLPVKGTSVEHSETYLLTVLGHTGMDKTIFTTEGLFTTVDFQGKLYADTPEGTLYVRCKSATLTALDTVGTPIASIECAPTHDGVTFVLDGTIPTIYFLLERK